jgi:hypothetical protein
MYSIFKVYDYKGGELNSTINLSIDGLAAQLSESFENWFDERDLDPKIMTIDDIEEEIGIAMKDSDFFSTYAGGDGFCGKIFEHKNNLLVSVQFGSFTKEIAVHIKNNWNQTWMIF